MHIEVRELKTVSLRGGTVIDGFPTVGLANAIACECIIESLQLEPVAIIDSDMFPSMATIYRSKPYFPARIHANEELNLAVFISELTLKEPLLKGIGKLVIQWAKEHECSLVLSVAGMPVDEGEHVDGMDILGAGSSERALQKIREKKIAILEHGAVSGIPGILLSEGRLENIDVIVFLIKVLKDVPDFRAAALVSQILSEFAPSCKCDTASLVLEAEKVERRLKKIQTESKSYTDIMYG
ncbi:MAG: PAC2 family protein [Nitrososphaerales archaeon]